MKSNYCTTCPECFCCELRKKYEQSPREYGAAMAICIIEREGKKGKR